MLRLLLVLLLAAFAVPAGATTSACHQPTTVMAHGATHQQHRTPKDERAAMHLCIGCVPTADWHDAPVAAPLLTPTPALAVRVATLDLGHDIPPATPPPRRG